MAILAPRVPALAYARVADELRDLSHARGGEKPAAPSDDAKAIVVPPSGAGLPIYGLPQSQLTVEALNDVAGALAAVRRLGWRFYVVDMNGSRLVDLLDRPGKPPPIALTVEGPSVDRFAEAGHYAEQDAPDRRFRPRVLEFGRLGMSELWLHGQGGDDLFYSLTDAAPTRRSAAEVFRDAAQRAQRRQLAPGASAAKTMAAKTTAFRQSDDRGG